MEPRRPWLVCCGLVTLDVLQVVDHVPAANEKVVARGLQVTFGGPAANAAATAVALGVPTRLVTAIGSGPVADLVRAGLGEAGVEVVDLVAGEAAAPAVSTVLVTRSTGERAVASVNGTGVGDLGERARGLLPGLLDDARAVLLDGHHLAGALALASAARERGIAVALDGGSWKDGLAELLAVVDHAVLSADFRLPAGMAGAGAAGPGSLEDLAAVAALGPGVVARSAGGGPLRWIDAAAAAPSGEGTVVRVVQPPAVPPGAVVDTLGAGDVLHGAFAARIALGDDVGAALAAGVEAATRSVRHAGARGWVAARDDGRQGADGPR